MKKNYFLICALAIVAMGAKAQGEPVAATKNDGIYASGEVGEQSYGVSIGTVDAQLYSGSGLSLNYFHEANYVAKTSENTYLGFSIDSNLVYDEETGEETTVQQAKFVAISSSQVAVTIPDSIRVDGVAIAVKTIYGDLNFTQGFTSNIKTLTIPASVTRIYLYYTFDRNLESIYMLGAAPQIDNRSISAPSIYVCNKSHISGYLGHSSFANSTIFPYGWDYDWITVNVEKTGEFAETYLTQHNYDWNAVQYLKVTGNINAIDLGAIKNLTLLLKLDLSETDITALPEEFMYTRRSLIEVKLPPTVSTIGRSAFNGCTALQTFDLNGIDIIGNSIFYGCKSLSYINLAGVKAIGQYAFSGCTSLNGIDLTSVQEFGYDSFCRCTALESVELSSATSIGTYAFRECTALKTVGFSENLILIEEGAFMDTALEEVKLPNGIESIGYSVFARCSKLTSVELPASLKTIADAAFEGCTKLSNVTLNTGLVSIGSSAFRGCTSLEEITIPSTVASLGSGAFNNTNIKTLKCYAVIPPSASSSFIGSGMDMTRTYLYVPPFSKDFYRNTPYWSDFYLMRSIEDQIDYIHIDRELTINLEEEDNHVVANNPEIMLTHGSSYIGQLTAIGEGTLSAGQLTINATLANRYGYPDQQYCPTLINYADKMRADNTTHTFSFYSNYWASSGEWHFISLPYDAKVSDILPSKDTYWVIRRYDSAARAAGETASTWVNLTNNDTMEAGKGYIISVTGGEAQLTFTSGNTITKNNIFRPTDIIVPLTEYTSEFAHNRSWNLIGNPYPSYFDMHHLNEEFTAPVTIWNGNAYVAYSPVDDDLVLSPYEAFFVQCPLDVANMTFKETGRLHSNTGKPAYKATIRDKEPIAAEDRSVFNFTLSNEASEDRARIVLNPEASMDYEIGRDASKFFADGGQHAQIYVSAAVNYSINERPVGDGIATLGIRADNESVYTLALSGKYNADWHVMLTDNLTGQTVDLTKESYQFYTSSNEHADRFSVKFYLGENGHSGIESISSEFGADANVTVTSIAGVTVFSGRLSEVSVPTAGIYIVCNGTDSRKVILQ